MARPSSEHARARAHTHARASARTRRYGAIVVGGGHNGLVAAAYLAMHGVKARPAEPRDARRPSRRALVFRVACAMHSSTGPAGVARHARWHAACTAPQGVRQVWHVCGAPLRAFAPAATRPGQDVLVLERRHLVGGAAVTEELVPGTP
jgi:2-polyprenyl-6-methoxyphenol hydroxylase-like FAD-dependent oxidoreductase